jgi:hypothetical protein
MLKANLETDLNRWASSLVYFEADDNRTQMRTRVKSVIHTSTSTIPGASASYLREGRREGERGALRMTRAILVFVPALMVLVLGFAGAASAQPHWPAGQGCVNQGKDNRVAGLAVCWAQRHLSWKSQHRPHFFLLGESTHTSLGLAWPPYIVYNSPNSHGRWRMFRIGFRYDRNWHGYIFPTAAWKVVANPLQY